MADRGYIGIVDLTVRLSSMNPLAHIGIAQANLQFERIVIKACRLFYDKSPRSTREKLLREGIILEGTSHKYFKFPNADSALEFSSLLRNLLVGARLPFKICLRPGELGGMTLAQAWGDRISSTTSELEKREVTAHFETSNIEKIEEIFRHQSLPVGWFGVEDLSDRR